jgi:predicted transcriptional regulator
MTDFKPKTGSFTAYMEYMQRDKEPSRRSQPSPLTLIELLQDRGEMAFERLETLSGMDASRYRDALKSLRDAGYVSVEGDPLDGVVKLTAKGVEVARLARPA